jgi:hypothetical protein
MAVITRRKAAFGLLGSSVFGLTLPAFAECQPAPPPVPPGAEFCVVSGAGALPLGQQQGSEWCWAATISNLFAYHGHIVPQPEIVATLTGGYLADIRGGVYCNMSNLTTRTWTDRKNGKQFSSRVTSAYDETCVEQVQPPPPQAVIDEINANRPLLIGTTNHAMLLIGVVHVGPQLLHGYVFDPGFGGVRFVQGGFGGEFLARRGGGQLLYIASAAVSS